MMEQQSQLGREMWVHPWASPLAALGQGTLGSHPGSLFPYVSYSEQNRILVRGDYCLLFIQCFCRCSRFLVDKG